MKLSLIIPVYNAEKFLVECLESVFQQELLANEYEVIIINDGSTDESKSIILDFQEKHSNLIIVDQINKGVSSARNAGLKIAKGNYITFIDSDDQITCNSLRKILEYCERLNLDLLYTSIENVDENGKHLNFQDAVGINNEVGKGFKHQRRTFPPTFYTKKIVKDISFNAEISFGEDTLFNAKAQAFADRVSYFDIPYYKYTVRENSLSKQGKTEKTFKGFLTAIEELRYFQNVNFPNDDEAKIYFDQIYEIFVARILELHISSTLDKIKYIKIIKLLEKNNLHYVLDGFGDKYPFVNQSFLQFSLFQKYISLKSKIHHLILKNA